MSNYKEGKPGDSLTNNNYTKNSPPDTEHLLAFTTKRLDDCAKALKRNWFYQLLLIAAAIAHTLKPSILTGIPIIKDIINGDKNNNDCLNIIIPMLLFGLFVKFGYLLWLYYSLRSVEEAETIDLLHEDKTPDPESNAKNQENDTENNRNNPTNAKNKIFQMCSRHTLFDIVYALKYSKDKESKVGQWTNIFAFSIVFLYTGTIMAMNHVITVHYLKHCQNNLIAALLILIYLAIISVFYIQFIKNCNTDHNYASWLAITSITVTITLVIMRLTAPNEIKSLLQDFLLLFNPIKS